MLGAVERGGAAGGGAPAAARRCRGQGAGRVLFLDGLGRQRLWRRVLSKVHMGRARRVLLRMVVETGLHPKAPGPHTRRSHTGALTDVPAADNAPLARLDTGVLSEGKRCREERPSRYSHRGPSSE